MPGQSINAYLSKYMLDNW